jgi:hypothetical protein
VAWKSSIRFQKRTFEGYKALVDYWNADKPDYMHANSRNVSLRVLKWQKKNRGQALTDHVISDCLTTRASKNAIQYKGRFYKGPANLYRVLDAKVGYKAFHLNLINWRKANPRKNPTDADLLVFAAEVRLLSSDGRRVSPIRFKWKELKEPKVSWSMLSKKIAIFRNREARDPFDAELAEMATPEREWLNDTGTKKYRLSDGRQITSEQFYNRNKFRKVSYGTWHQRITNNYNRTGKRPTAEEALALMREWGVADRCVGILYKWTHRPSGKVYIGITTESLEERIRGHLRTAQSNDHNSDGLHAEINRSGLDSFEIKELGRYEDLKELAAAEYAAIEEHQCLMPHGFNLVEGGRGVSLRMLPLPFRGQKYKNLAALANAHGMPVKRVESRLRLGWSIDEAVDIARGMQRKKPFHAMSNKNIAQLAKENRLLPGTVYARISDLGWTLEEALGIVEKLRVGGNAKSVIVNGVEFASHARAAKHFGIPEGAWRKRLKSGWTPKQAAELEPPPEVKRPDLLHAYNKKT